mmetsp:Transcript_43091/g.130184  ORF Transcript_43091/g.130184 Transcript_43091/m.130184 type:complete len:217 (-) Transcript_43091:983-1633(-)
MCASRANCSPTPLVNTYEAKLSDSAVTYFMSIAFPKIAPSTFCCARDMESASSDFSIGGKRTDVSVRSRRHAIAESTMSAITTLCRPLKPSCRSTMPNKTTAFARATTRQASCKQVRRAAGRRSPRESTKRARFAAAIGMQRNNARLEKPFEAQLSAKKFHAKSTATSATTIRGQLIKRNKVGPNCKKPVQISDARYAKCNAMNLLARSDEYWLWT